MLAEKDALATALYERYNKLAMPNLRLNEVEIGALLAYLDEQPAPAADARAHAHEAGEHAHR